ncbi:hypothetical protein ACFW89_35495 [Streptomyces albidoflavus]
MDEEQAFLARAGVVRDVRGQEVDGPVGEEPTVQPADEAASA